MKRFVSLILSLILILTLAACAAPTEPTQTDAPQSASTPEPDSASFETGSTVSVAALELAQAMPVVAYDNIPLWRGQTIIPPEWDAQCCLDDDFAYREESIELCAEMGFNFVRCPLQFKDLFLENGQAASSYLPNTDAFHQLDRLLEYCAQYGIHVCFDLHFCPGFSTDGNDEDDILFSDADSRAAFVLFWQTLATYFQTVPANLLSFNLLNEPHANEPLDEATYVDLMKEAISAIRGQTPDRLIIVSGIGASWAEPLYSLVDEKVAQGSSSYFLANGTSQWPVYGVSKNQDSAGGDHTITLQGSFPAETEFVFSPMQYCTTKFTIYADNEILCAFDINGEIYDGTGLTQRSGEMDMDWHGDGSVYGWYTVSCSLATACSELRIVEESGYYELQSLTVKTPSQQYQMSGYDGLLSSTDAPHLYLDSSGEISAENEQTLYVMDDEAIDGLIKRYVDFTAQTGVSYIALEAGFDPSIDEETALAACQAFVTAANRYDFSWCFWPDAHGLLLHTTDRKIRLEQWGEEYPLRAGAEYVQKTEHYAVDQRMLDILGLAD